MLDKVIGMIDFNLNGDMLFRLAMLTIFDFSVSALQMPQDPFTSCCLVQAATSKVLCSHCEQLGTSPMVLPTR